MGQYIKFPSIQRIQLNMFFLATSDYKILVRHLESRYLVKYIDDVNLYLGGTVGIESLCIVVSIVCGGSVLGPCLVNSI